mgnify:FL=1
MYFTVVKQLFSLLEGKQKLGLLAAQVLIIIAACCEVLSVSFFGAFIAVLSGGPGTGVLEMIKSFLPGFNKVDFGLITVVVMGVSALINMVAIYVMAILATRVGVGMSNKLLSSYLEREWLEFTSFNSSDYIKKMAVDAQRATDLVIQPMLSLNVRVIVAIGLCTYIFLLDPVVALVGFLVLFSAYGLLYFAVRRLLSSNSQKISFGNSQRYFLINQAFHVFRDIKLKGSKAEVVNDFEVLGRPLSKAMAQNIALTQVPKYFIEFFALGSVVGLVLFTFRSEGAEFNQLVPVLALYAFAGYKLIPAVQQCYSFIAQIRGGFESFKDVMSDVIVDGGTLAYPEASPLVIEERIILQDIKFGYGKSDLDVNVKEMQFKKGSLVGITGHSGCGKSTLLHIVAGLIPSDGSIICDGRSISKKEFFSLRKLVAFVSQDIRVLDGTIAENVAFGVKPSEVDKSRVLACLETAALLSDFSPDEIFVRNVGEGGYSLSGGQRQRLSIARALYQRSPVLIFDEATSALDINSEAAVMEGVRRIQNCIVIVVAHRLATLRYCDYLYIMEKGRVVNEGNPSIILDGLQEPPK